MKTRWIIDGYTSANHATNAANKRGESGVKESDQFCGPIDMDYFKGCRGWVYETWDGRLLVPGGEVPKRVMVQLCKRIGLEMIENDGNFMCCVCHLRIPKTSTIHSQLVCEEAKEIVEPELLFRCPHCGPVHCDKYDGRTSSKTIL